MLKTVKNAIVATTPRFLDMTENNSICSFRVADNRNDEGFTYWYTISGFGAMAYWMQANISKGNRIDVTGIQKAYGYTNQFGEHETLWEITADDIVIDGISAKVSVEDQAEADAIADAVEKPKHSCTCRHCYINA